MVIFKLAFGVDLGTFNVVILLLWTVTRDATSIGRDCPFDHVPVDIFTTCEELAMIVRGFYIVSFLPSPSLVLTLSTIIGLSHLKSLSSVTLQGILCHPQSARRNSCTQAAPNSNSSPTVASASTPVAHQHIHSRHGMGSTHLWLQFRTSLRAEELSTSSGRRYPFSSNLV